MTPRHPISIILLLLALTGTATPVTAQDSADPSSTRKAIVIAHRGASALRPEHTLAAYTKAIEDGADWIEPDLVSTKDGFLVARHENEIGGTTDVAAHPEFAARKTRKSIDGEKVSGWFTEDFTLAELKTLRARERLPQLRSTQYDGQFEIATLEEIIALVASESARRGRVIGLVPEIKHPTYFAGLGLPMEDKLLATLAAHEYTRSAPVEIQSFETGNLEYLRGKVAKGSHVTLLQLLGGRGDRPWDLASSGKSTRYGDLMKAEELREVAAYADAIGPSYKDLDIEQADGRWRSALVDDAHAAGLQVHVYTFRPENHFLQRRYRDNAGEAARNEAGSIREIRDHLAAGIDAFFTDDPALGRRAVDGL